MDVKKIGKSIEMVRKEKGLTQQQLADMLNTSQKSISRWENGRTIPDISLYEPLCSALEVEVSELLYGKRMNDDEKVIKGEITASNLFVTKSQLETIGIFSEVLIVVGMIIAITFTKLFANNFIEMLITLIPGWFVWGFGLALRVMIKKSLQKIQ